MTRCTVPITSVIGLLVLVAGCGASTPTATPSTTTSSTATPTSEAAASTPATAASPAPTAGQTVRVSYAAGQVTGDTGKIAVAVGTTVTLAVTSDVADEVHLHGYDKSVDVPSGGTAMLTFVADIPGGFEVKLEALGTQLLELQVS